MHIIFTPDVEEAMLELLRWRHYVVPEENKYFFAVPQTTSSYIYFYTMLQRVAKASGMNNPELVTSTRLRKYAATMFQVSI